jgi:hypothetical protein
VVVRRLAVFLGLFQFEAVLTAGIERLDQRAGQGHTEKDQRDQRAEGEQETGDAGQRDRAPSDADEAVNNADGPGSGLDLGPLQGVVVAGILIVLKVNCNRTAVYDVGHLVGKDHGLELTGEPGQRTEQGSEQRCRGGKNDPEEDRAKGGKTGLRRNPRLQSIDGALQEVG